MSAELQDDTIIDIYNNAITYMKSKDIQSFSEAYFRILESEDVDLNILLDVTDNDDNEFHKNLNDYLNPDEDYYDDDEDDDEEEEL